MSSYKSTFMRTLEERGYIHQATDDTGLDAAADAGVVTAYIGFDCTAPSLHVGSLVQIMMLRHLQKCGHRPIVLLGGATTLVGDPSGRDESRLLLTSERIAANMASIRTVFEQFLSFGDGPTDAIYINNSEWLEKLNYIEFLRDIGGHFSINRMLTFDSIKTRLEREQTLTFLEFNYMILQAYDFLELNRRFDCTLQMGGSDQWGNIVNGMELARRIDSASLFGLTTPLITTADGGKMGKTAKGAVWLNADQLSDHDYWQFWRNTQDGDVGRFLRLFTELPLDEIVRLEGLEGAGLNEAKKILANATTTLCRGESAAENAARTAAETFEQGGGGAGLRTLEVKASAASKDGFDVIQVFVDAGLAESKKAARRLKEQGGARLNGEVISPTKFFVSLADFDSDGIIKVSAGKKRHALVKLVD